MQYSLPMYVYTEQSNMERNAVSLLTVSIYVAAGYCRVLMRSIVPVLTDGWATRRHVQCAWNHLYRSKFYFYTQTCKNFISVWKLSVIFIGNGRISLSFEAKITKILQRNIWVLKSTWIFSYIYQDFTPPFIKIIE